REHMGMPSARLAVQTRSQELPNEHLSVVLCFFFQAEDGIRDDLVTGVQTCALPIYDKAQDDFARVIHDHPGHAEAHAGLGYVHACRNRNAEAQREANLALLHGAGDYLVLHNIACIYAELSAVDNPRLQEYQNLALDELGRAVQLWKREPATFDG